MTVFIRIVTRNGKEIIVIGKDGHWQKGEIPEYKICKYLRGQVEKCFSFIQRNERDRKELGIGK